MSLVSWKAEYYPVEADVPKTSAEAVAHSIRKWEGLRPENLERHGVIAGGFFLRDSDSDSFVVDLDSCALCMQNIYNCAPCPLFIVRGNVSCDRVAISNGELKSPFHIFHKLANPEPMLMWLKKAQEATA